MKKKLVAILGVVAILFIGVVVLVLVGVGLLGREVAKKTAILEYSNKMTAERDKIVEKLDAYSYSIDNAETFAEIDTSYAEFKMQIDAFKTSFEEEEIPEGADAIKTELENYVSIIDKILVAGEKFTVLVATEEEYMTNLNEYNGLISDMNKSNDKLNELVQELTGAKIE